MPHRLPERIVKVLFRDYVPSGRVAVVNKMGRDAFCNSGKNGWPSAAGPGKWRVFWNGTQLLLPQIWYDKKRQELRIHSYMTALTAPWLHEAVTTVSSQLWPGKRQAFAPVFLTGTEAVKSGCCGYELEWLETVGGGPEFKLIPMWDLPKEFASGESFWRAELRRRNIKLTCTYSRKPTDSFHNSWFAVSPDTHFPAHSPLMTRDGWSWVNPHAHSSVDKRAVKKEGYILKIVQRDALLRSRLLSYSSS